MFQLRKRALQIHETLLKVFGEPIWRNPLPAVDELVSTILSQNTNDVNRDRAFDALRAKFPTWEAVRDAKEKDVIAAIKPAGLANQKGSAHSAGLRARLRRSAARLICNFSRICPWRKRETG
ncbi:MAG: hypothetical protein HND47_02740 [Chloroflexi bacterium]|nr:hypothetical protein [Chloroflexota bacterium]